MRVTKILTLLVGLCACGSGEGMPPAPSGHVSLGVEDAPVRGPADARVTLIEFADFQCPYCRAAAPVIRDLLSRYPEDLRVAYRHFLLPPSRHPDALPAALAAECARRQGLFWEMADRLMQSDLDEQTLREQALGIPDLDFAEWDRCRSSEEARSRVQADQDLGRKSGVDVTPTFVVNGDVYRGYLSLPVMERIVEQALAAAVAHSTHDRAAPSEWSRAGWRLAGQSRRPQQEGTAAHRGRLPD